MRTVLCIQAHGLPETTKQPKPCFSLATHAQAVLV